MRLLLVVIILCTVFPITVSALCEASSGTCYYVATNGNDANAGTSEASPYRTFKKGIEQVLPGDIVYVRGGTYDGSYSYYDTHNGYGKDMFIGLDKDFTTSGTPSNPITIKNYPGEVPYITTANSPNGDGLPVGVQGVSHWIVEGFDITGGIVSIAASAHDIIIRNNNVHDLVTSGGWNPGLIKVLDGGTDAAYNIYIHNNTLHDLYDSWFPGDWGTINNDSKHFGGVTLMSTCDYQGSAYPCTGYVEIINNTIYNVPQLIFQKNIMRGPTIIRGNRMYNADKFALFAGGNNIISHNLVYNITSSMVWSIGDADNQFADQNLKDLSGANHTFENNTFVGWTQTMINFNNYNGNNHIKNNIFYGIDNWSVGNQNQWPATYVLSDSIGDPADPNQGTILSQFEIDNNCYFAIGPRALHMRKWSSGVRALYNFTEFKAQFPWLDTTSLWYFDLDRDPSDLFVDYDGGDLHLQNPSQCLGRGFYQAESGSPPQPPNPPQGIAQSYPGDAGIGNDPRVIFFEDFEKATIQDVYNHWTDVKSGSYTALVNEGPLGATGSKAVRFNTVAGGGGDHLYKNFQPGYDELFYRFYVKIPSNVEGSHHFGRIGGENPVTSWLPGGAGQLPAGDDHWVMLLEPYLLTQSKWGWFPNSYWMAMHPCCSPPQYWGSQWYYSTWPTVDKDQWISVEYRVKMNNPTTAYNGEFTAWIDGVMIYNLTQGSPNGDWVSDHFNINPASSNTFEGFRWRNDASLDINWIAIEMYFPESTRYNEVFFDNVVVATQYIGPIVPTGGLQTCAAQSGTICQPADTCSGNTLPASDSSFCCDATCIPPSPPSNITVLVDSSYSGDDPYLLVDNIIDPATRSLTWGSAESSNPHWVELVFNENKTIGNVTIWWAYNTVQSMYTTSQQVDIQYWNGAWQTIGSVGGSNQASSTLTFTPVLADRLRLYQPANMGASTYDVIMWMAEIDYDVGGAVCCGSYDTDCSRAVETGELTSAIQDWYADSISIAQLLQTIRYWKVAC